MSRELIDDLDISVFDHIHSQTTSADKRALLALQIATARHCGQYSYLEIGSHLGGSIQPYLMDKRCRTIYSIDLRPLQQPDDRGELFDYPDNSTERMLENLRQIDELSVSKIKTFDSDAREIDPGSVADAPHLCFIDGEHTTEAVFSDFLFCLSVARSDATICFHDADVIYPGLRRIIKRLRSERATFQSMMMSGTVFAIVMGESPLRTDATLAQHRRSWRRFQFWAGLRMAYRRRLGDTGKSILRPLARPIIRYLRG